jgi:microcompartment protein CcmL/EutN
MLHAIGLVEFQSIARGIDAADTMIKTSEVELLTAKPVCPGKYIVLISGDVSAVENAVEAGKRKGNECVVDDFIIPNVHESVIKAFSSATGVSELKALGVIETFSIASLIVAADTAVKAAEVELIEIRIGLGIGGKSYVTLTGDVGAVKASINAGVKVVSENGLLVEKTVIPSPHESLKEVIL